MSVTNINGSNGKYDNIVADSSVKYGRNSVDNYINYLEKPLVNDIYNPAPILELGADQTSQQRNIDKLDDFVYKNDAYLNSLPPIEFEYRYMPNNGVGRVDKKALLGAAYEELGALEYTIKDFNSRFLIDDTFTSEPLDINKDGKIDVSEYSTNILAADMMSKPSPDITRVDGTINSKGFNAAIEYTKKANAAKAAKLYGELYRTYDLSSAYNSFKENANNTIK